MVAKRTRKSSKPRSAPNTRTIGDSQFRSLIETALDIVAVLNNDGVIRYLSPAIERVTGFTPEELIGKNAFDFMHEDDAREQFKVFSAVVSDPGLATTGEPHSFRFRHKDGHWVLLESISTKLPDGPEPSGIVVNARDLTGHVRAHEAMRESADRERRLAEEHAVIAEVGRVIGSTLNIQEVFELFAAEVKRLINFDMIAASVIDHSRQTTTIRYWSGPVDYRLNFRRAVPLSGTLTGEVVASGKPVLVNGTSSKDLRKRFVHLSDNNLGQALSWLGIPMVNRGEMIGSLLLFSSEQGAFSDEDIALADRVSYQIAGAINNAELFDELKNAETDLAESNDRNQMILETAHDAFVGIDETGHVSAWNSQAEATFGWQADEAMGRLLADLIIPERFVAQHRAGLSQFLATEQGPVVNQRVEMTAKHRDGREFPVELTISPMRLGGRYLFNAFIRDITVRKESEDALRRSEERFRAIYNNAPNGMGTRTLDGVTKDLNPAFLNMLGYTLDEIKKLEQEPGTLYDAKYREIEKKLIEDALRGEDIPPYEKEYIRKDGSTVFTEVRASLERDNQGNPIGIVSVVTDITERRSLEQEIAQYTQTLETANEELQQLDRMKDEFISTVSHELRTPLTSIKGSAEILLTFDDDDRETRMEFLRIINKECDRLTRLVTDVLDLSRMESRQMSWVWEDADMPEIVAAAVDGTQSLLMQKDLYIKVELDHGLPGLWNDRDRLVQVVTNLLSNSIKFTPRGGRIWINAKKVKANASDGLGEKLEICVSDTGIGIPESEFGNIFQKFTQVGEKLSDKPTGTGLGLPICKEIVEFFGGEIWVKSTPGKGSSFFFTVPVTAEEQIREPEKKF